MTPKIERSSSDGFADSHPAAAASFSAGLWASLAAISGVRARDAWREGDRHEAFKAAVVALASGAVAAAVVSSEFDIDNPFRFE